MANDCAGLVQGTFTASQCSRKGTVERDGVFYCRTHDPVAIQSKQDAKRAEQRDAMLANEARKDAALARAKKIGRGYAHYVAYGNPAGYTGGLVLTPEECDSLAEELDRMAKIIEDLRGESAPGEHKVVLDAISGIEEDQ